MLRVQGPVTIEEIERHLADLGSGNHADNLARVREHAFRYLVELTVEELLGLVFLQSASTAEIAPQGADRRLRAVALRAVDLGPKRLAPNWDLAQIRERCASAPRPLPPLLLRDARGSERDHRGTWYLQDGCHRGLAVAMAVVEGEAFTGLNAYVASHRQLT